MPNHLLKALVVVAALVVLGGIVGSSFAPVFSSVVAMAGGDEPPD